MVQVRGTDPTALSDSAGDYMLPVRVSGEQVVEATHPKLELPGVETKRTALLSLGDTVQLGFAVPAAPTMARSQCGSRTDRAGIVGMVWDAAGKPVAGSEVEAVWRAASGETRRVRDRSGKEGLFVLCNVPPDERVTVSLPQSGDAVTLELEWGSYRWVDMRKK
jgi:hypothetical protein